MVKEPGADNVEPLVPEAVISAVNLSEVVGKLGELGMSDEKLERAVEALGLEVIAFDEVQAYEAGKLRKVTRQYGLSLGDRACLALAHHRKHALPVVIGVGRMVKPLYSSPGAGAASADPPPPPNKFFQKDIGRSFSRFG